MDTAQIFELLARGGAAALSLHLAVTFLDMRNGSWAARLGCLFATAVAAYALVSSNFIAAHLGPVNYLLNLLAIPLSVFFWWFATALFDDGFRWRWWRLLPLAPVTIFSTWHFMSPAGSAVAVIALTIWQMVVLCLMAHAALLGLRDLRDDLVEPRRRFRVAVAAIVGATGMAIVVAEVSYAHGAMPNLLFQLQAGVLIVLTFLFSVWAGRARDSLFTRPAPVSAASISPAIEPSAEGGGIQPEDQALAARLETAIQDGIYREPGLTVGVLANRLDTPEHRLRKLINQGLGYRNFSSFLNQYRIGDAKRALADPEQARIQVLTIALDLGYGSIAPFNRAFKEWVGQTPTDFRKSALRDGAAR